jgi:hypothetical protein
MEPLYDRLGRFLRRLEHETFLELLSEEPGTLTRR